MTKTATQPTAVTAWYTDVDDAPADSQAPAHPSRTRAWASAWQHVTTEQVLARHHAVIDDGALRETVSFQFLADRGSPCWNMIEPAISLPFPLVGPVLHVGSPYATYNGAGTATSAHAYATVEAAQNLAAELGACAVVYTGLTTGQATRLRAASTSAGGGRAFAIPTTLTHTRQLGPTSESWWTGMPPRYRRDLRRQWRRGTDAGLTLTAYNGNELRKMAPAFTCLANGTAAKHTGGADLYGTDMIHHLADIPGSVLLAAHDNTGALAGGFFGWLHRHCLYLWAAGIDPSHPATRHTYTWLLAEAAHWAIGQGAKELDLGRGNHHAKMKAGSSHRPLVAVICEPATRG